MSEESYRIEVSNIVLDCMGNGIWLYKDRELKMLWGPVPGKPLEFGYRFPARLRSDGSWPMFGYNQRPCGGTGFQALAQLIRYVRDSNRLPIQTWKYWTSEKIGMARSTGEGERLIKTLEASDYGNPEKTKCVLCGSTEFSKGIDWWNLDGVIGPSCLYGTCRDNK